MRYFTSQIGLIWLNALVLLLGQLLIKHGLKAYGPISLTGLDQFFSLIRYALVTPLLILGYVLSVLSGFLWIITLSRMEMSFAVPLYTGIYYVLLLLASILVLGETVGWVRGIGAGLILTGIVLVTSRA